jgi:predicted dehydrogenase
MAHLSYGRWHDIEVEDDVTAIFKYKNGATGVFVTSTSETPGVNRFEVSGTKGRLVSENGKLIYYKNKVDTIEQIKTATEGFVAPNFEKIEVETDGKNPQHEGIIQNFTNAILGKEEVFALGVDGYNGVALMDAMQLSGWKNGAEVALPFDDDEYIEILNEKIKTSRLKDVEDKVANTAGTY